MFRRMKKKDLEKLEFEKRFPTRIILNKESYGEVVDYLGEAGIKHEEEGYSLYTFEGKKGEIVSGRIDDLTLELSLDLDEEIEKIISYMIKK